MERSVRGVAGRVRPWHLNVVLTVAFAALMAVWSVAMPLFEAPDERQHVEMIEYRASGGAWPSYDDFYTVVATRAECQRRTPSSWTCPDPARDPTLPRELVPLAAEDAPVKAELPTLEAYGGLDERSSVDRNQMLQHPTLYYDLQAKVLQLQRWVTGERSFAGDVAFLRLVSVLMMAPLPVLCWWAGRRFGLGQRSAFTAALVPFAIPQLANMGGLVNNDVLQNTLGALVIALAAGVFRGDRSWRTAVGLGLACAAGLLTKSSFALLLPMVGAAYAVGWLRSGRRETRAWAAPAGVAGLLAVVGGGWWYVGNRVRHGSFVPSIHSDTFKLRVPPPGWTPDTGYYTEILIDRMPSRFWGHFGTFSARQSWPVILGATIVGLSVLVLAFVLRPGRDDRASEVGGWRRLSLLVLLTPFVGLFAMVVVRSWGIYSYAGDFAFMQGRYSFPAIAGVAVVAAGALGRLFGRWAALAVAAFAALMQGDAFLAVLRIYWGPPGTGLTDQVHSMLAWTPWPAALVKGGLVVAALVAVAGLAACILTVIGVGPPGPSAATGPTHPASPADPVDRAAVASGAAGGVRRGGFLQPALNP